MPTQDLQSVKLRYNIVGNCEALNHVLDVALQVAPTNVSVLIVGESGVGKEVVPRIIHDNSPRRREKYFAINCGSIPEGTIDSELFGHVKGSFTGAINDSPGYFGVTDKGTLFLDEVGELPMATQARLLRVLETGEYIPVGGTEVRKCDVRVVAATNVNMSKAISEGRFREDLYYRLNTITVQMPPLRDRGEDVVLLFRLFASQMADKYRMERITLTDEAKQMLMRYKWPGNVRQLKNFTEQLSILSKERVVTPEMLAHFLPQDRESTQLATIPHQGGGDHSFENEREILYKILFELRGNVNDLRREMGLLKKQLENNGPTTIGGVRSVVDPSLSASTLPASPLSSSEGQVYIRPTRQTDEFDEVEEYIEPSHSDDFAKDSRGVKERENLNLNDLERITLEKALERSGGNRKKAAEQLGISDRTLYRRLKQYGLMMLAMLMVMACSVSYKFNGASIDYTKTKTIQIADFPIRASYVWGPMAVIFNNQLKDQYANHTRLSQVKRNGDLKVEGEITRYEQRNKAVSAEGYSAQTELSMTVNVRFTNAVNHEEDFERQFTSTRSYETTQSLQSVQEELVTQMCKDLCDQIFNATVANW
jgi:DNA-binding NtrC family response regulator